MSDVYCPKCGEPVDMDEFHEAAEEQGVTFGEIFRRFFREGCSALWFKCNPHVDRDMADMSAIMYDIMGDDVDGISTMSEDFDTLRRIK